MRYALISDIHSNLEAFLAVIETISKDKPDKYLCIGDIIGYGADPKEVIRLVEFLNPEIIVAGNHEWGVAGLLDIEYFNKDAQSAISWTKDILNNSEMDYIETFKIIYKHDDFTLVHGSLETPEEFHYIMNKADAYVTSDIMKTKICFVGHSHIPGIFYTAGARMEELKGRKVKMEPDKRYVINIGSVGQPRDGDPRASYAIYDTEDASVEIKRVAYDIESAKDKILKAELPSFLAYRLLEGR